MNSLFKILLINIAILIIIRNINNFIGNSENKIN